MPLSFNPAAAGSLKGKIQFDVSGDENFTGYLSIAGGKCTYHDGQTDKPQLLIQTPADVWVKISTGVLNGPKAFMDGLFKVEGDRNLLMKMGELFQPPPRAEDKTPP
jgi:putative sterol carrier protein